MNLGYEGAHHEALRGLVQVVNIDNRDGVAAPVDPAGRPRGDQATDPRRRSPQPAHERRNGSSCHSPGPCEVAFLTRLGLEELAHRFHEIVQRPDNPLARKWNDRVARLVIEWVAQDDRTLLS